MEAFDFIAEQRIREAIQRGEFDHLPGAGKPLVLDDDSLVPEELRMAYRILKNAGFVPPEVEACREIAALEKCLASAHDEEQLLHARRRLQALQTRLALSRAGRGLAMLSDYRHRLLEKLSKA